MRLRPILLLIAVLIAVLLLASEAPAGASSPRGDANCSGTADGRDALDMLLVFAGDDVTVPDECAPIGLQSAFGLGGDVNCDGEFDLLDPITSLELVGGLPVGPCLALSMTGFGKVSEELGYSGGTLTTTGLDGTTYTLEVPEGALAAAELISMTPVDSIDNLPIEGGLVAAVDLQPSALLLWEPAILTIEPIADIPVEEQAAFVISQGEFAQHPFVLDSAEMRLPLTHFSAAGVGAGEVQDVAPPTLSGDAYTAQVAPLVNAERAARLGGSSGDPDFEEKLAAIIDPYIEGLIASLEVTTEPSAVVAGVPACAGAEYGAAVALGYGSGAPHIGGNSGWVQLILGAIQDIPWGLCREEAFDRCVDEHDLNAIAAIVAFTRIMQALGTDSSPSPMKEMIEKCGRFELHFSSWFCVDNTTNLCTGCSAPGCPRISISYVAEDLFFSMSTQPGAGPLGGAPLELVKDKYAYQGCNGTYTSTGSTFELVGGGVSMNLYTLVYRDPQVSLVINPGIPPENLHLNCFGGSDQPTTLWWQKWCSWHQPELTPPFADTAALCFYNDEPDGWDFEISDWIYDASLAFGVKQYNRNYRQVGVLEIGWESSIISLRHEPIR